jgi:hypothetical protein
MYDLTITRSSVVLEKKNVWTYYWICVFGSLDYEGTFKPFLMPSSYMHACMDVFLIIWTNFVYIRYLGVHPS